MYDLIIIGGGPAGVAAGVYAARKRLKTLLIVESFGGQSVESVGIENWIGTPKISGEDLAKVLEAHIQTYASTADSTLSITRERAQKVSRSDEGFSVATDTHSYTTKSVLVATGSSRKKLDIPGVKEYENKGITYCASCDGPLFADQNVAVIGGGNAGFESAAQLLAYAKSVTLLNRSETFRADPVTVERVTAHPNFKAVMNAVPKEVKGDTFVNSLIYTDTSTGEDRELSVTGIFVEIGNLPATGLVDGLISLDEYKRISVDPKTCRTSVEGIWAAGDCTDGLYHQNNIAAGDAVKALEDLYLYLRA